ncbi:hypothetical protein AVEN_227865-1 [Araneus ventricosus]|uniref:Uncharacterized protein n=1 Tax=Araneus ventricosus TaxID=182803 RepID=A0A4Y2QZC5_ARAVE|nr:hypothetical protein AVEN_227865-1 [Araneus ventricosus]
MDASCYCIAHNKDSPVLDQTSSMELDAALHELGMLSKVTDSRVDYLNEKMRRKRTSNSLSSAPLCVVQMNSKFVTKFSLSRNSCSESDSEGESDDRVCRSPKLSSKLSKVRMEPSVIFDKLRGSDAYRRRHARMYKPYDILWKKRMQTEKDVTDILAAVTADRASPPTVSRQDSGNKSNPSSPVKSQSYPASSGSSIVRSRSLDDLEISKLDYSKDDCCCYGRSDIDTVSQRISKLHVS